MYILLLSAVAVATASFAQTAVTVPPSAWRAALPARERPLTLPEKVEPGQLHLAVPLDHAGRLEDALPLYHARAEQTQTVADRLRYAGALLRSGRQEDARKVFDALLVERQSGPHGSASSNLLPCASAMIIQGFPDLAVERLRPAHRESPADRRLGLLLARALAATGDRAGARSVLAEIGKGLDTWDAGALVELARSYLLAGDPTSARSLLNRDIDESVGHMMRDSVLANLSLLEGDWAGATKLLANGKRKGPPGLDEERVNRTWRNVQRELRSMQLRLGLGLWREGKPEAAMDEVARAAMSDEEYVRSAALMLGVAGNLAKGRHDAAERRLAALGGHDRCFLGAVERTKGEMGAGRQPAEGLRMLEEALASEDRSADFVTRSVVEVLREAARPAKPAPTPNGPP